VLQQRSAGQDGGAGEQRLVAVADPAHLESSPMRTLLLTLHVVAAIFVIGPLVAAANQTGRALREADLGVLRALSRLVRIYGWASLAVGVLGVALVRRDWRTTFDEGWVIASLVLFVVASALVLGLLAPQLGRAVGIAEAGRPTRDLVGRVAPVGGVVSLLYLAVAVLMVSQPGG
jgi:uncharacterized membrane protein